jgi:diadenosine tetraphosphate (Ap4A) HIT family hydrolase
MDCSICEYLSPASTATHYPIHEGTAWLLEHTANPTAVEGWLRLVARRHIEALHELTPAEWQELTALLGATTAALHAVTGSDKEYLMCFAEGAGTRHIHLHVVPKQADLPEDQRGAKIFSLLNVPADQAVSAEAINSFIEAFRAKFPIKADVA